MKIKQIFSISQNKHYCSKHTKLLLSKTFQVIFLAIVFGYT